MDLFSWLPIIIFIYAISTIFGSNKKKPQNRRPPTTRTQGPQDNRAPYSRQETKPARTGWREMFEELERELFPKEEPISRPSQPSQPSPAPRYPSTSQSYGREGSERVDSFSTEGSWGTEGTAGVEGSAGREGMLSTFSGEIGQGSSGKPERKPGNASSQPIEQARPVFPAVSENPLVQGIVWAEVLGKPRAHNKYAYNRRI